VASVEQLAMPLDLLFVKPLFEVDFYVAYCYGTFRHDVTFCWFHSKTLPLRMAGHAATLCALNFALSTDHIVL